MRIEWHIRHKPETVSTNLDARAGTHGDVFTAGFQTAGRGRLDHKWLSAPGENLMMSAVLDVGVCPPEHVATLPLVVGLAVIKGLSPLVEGLSPLIDGGQIPLTGGLSPEERARGLSLKWPNDILFKGRKLAGILCERHGDFVIVGLGVNVNQTKFAPEIEKRATSLALIRGSVPDSKGPVPISAKGSVPIPAVRDAILASLAEVYGGWLAGGLSPFLPLLAELDFLRGRTVSVKQTDDDAEPVRGVCEGIAADGSLLVGGRSIYAGEAHVDSSQWYG